MTLANSRLHLTINLFLPRSYSSCIVGVRKHGYSLASLTKAVVLGGIAVRTVKTVFAFVLVEINIYFLRPNQREPYSINNNAMVANIP